MKYIKSLFIAAALFLSSCGHSPENGTIVEVVIDEKVVCEGIVIGGHGYGGQRDDRVFILILENGKPTDRHISVHQGIVRVKKNVEK